MHCHNIFVFPNILFPESLMRKVLSTALNLNALEYCQLIILIILATETSESAQHYQTLDTYYYLQKSPDLNGMGY